MAIRTTLAELIDYTRQLIGDEVTPGQAPRFSDPQIQRALDRRRLDVRYEALMPQVTLTATAYQYLDYYSEYGYFEDDVSLIGPNYQAVTPTTAELLLDTAHWVFPAGAGVGQYPPVFLAGKSFDLYGTAADLLETWAGSLATTTYDFSADGASFKRSQIRDGLLTRASGYRSRQRVGYAASARDDGSVHPLHPEAGPVSENVPRLTGD